MRTSRSIAVASLAGATILALGGCSQHENTDPGAAPGEQGIRDVVSVYSQALADGDGPRACSLMSPTAQHSLVARTAASDCLAAVKTVHDGLSSEAAGALPSVEVTAITQEGDDAAAITVSFPDPGMTEATAAVGGQALHVVRVDARWGIDAA
jgi:hypothetical protein